MSQTKPAGKIFGIGLSRTGTTSLYMALRKLGYRAGTYRHMHKMGLRDWFRGDFARDHLGRYEALTDLPIATFFPDLDRRYPGSKFALTVREIDSWLVSVRRHFAGTQRPRFGFPRNVRIATYGINGFNPERFHFVYEAHFEIVKRYFRDRPEDLLVIDIVGGQGWDDLCPFLGREIPEDPFPHVKQGVRPRSRTGS